nr:DUF1589 domain-containing protein [Rhodopirellula europaea]
MLCLRPDPGRHRRPRSHRLVGPDWSHLVVGQVITWHPADALEQSEASRQTPRRTTSPPPGKTWPTPPRYSLST